MNSAGEVLHGSDVLIEDDRIARIFHGAAPRDLQADRVLECAGKIVLPGLVSAHTHLTGMFQRGLWDETSFESWVGKYQAPQEGIGPPPQELFSVHHAARPAP